MENFANINLRILLERSENISDLRRIAGIEIIIDKDGSRDRVFTLVGQQEQVFSVVDTKAETIQNPNRAISNKGRNIVTL